VQHLNFLYNQEPAFYELDDTHEGFEWIDFSDSDNSVISFLRKSRAGESLLFVVNATPVVREAYRVGAPAPGFYQEILNTDAQTYGGSNAGNCGGLEAEDYAWQGRQHSLQLRLPPLSVIGFKRVPAAPAAALPSGVPGQVK
jgi:1,4-alpha-glucan branching enzyme